MSQNQSVTFSTKSPSTWQLINNSIEDFSAISKYWRLWIHLGWNDIQQRYAGSFIGPFWITLSMIIFIGAFSLVYGRLFHQPLQTYVPFLTAGILLWTYITAIIAESCDMFVNSREYINSMNLPYSIFLYRLIWRNIIILTHNAIVFIIIMAIFSIPINLNTLFFIPGFTLLTIALAATATLISLIATRYRDIPPIINSIIQIAFFVSPITWMPSLIGIKSKIILYNPITHFLDITRSPLLGKSPSTQSFEICIILTIIIFCLASYAYGAKRRLIPFWL